MNGEGYLNKSAWPGFCVHVLLQTRFGPHLSKLNRCPLMPVTAAALLALAACWDFDP